MKNKVIALLCLAIIAVSGVAALASSWYDWSSIVALTEESTSRTFNATGKKTLTFTWTNCGTVTAATMYSFLQDRVTTLCVTSITSATATSLISPYIKLTLTVTASVPASKAGHGGIYFTE
jgi:hypothetical protein